MSDAYYSPVGGREAKAAALRAMSWHIALGRGYPAWDAASRVDAGWASALAPDPAGMRGLADEIGRRIADEVAFVAPDPAGEIIMSDSRWRRSAVPTGHLLVTATLDFPDAEAETIREVGVFAGGAAAAETPPGQLWLSPADVAAPGHMVRYGRYAVPHVKSAGNRLTLQFVESF